MNIHNFNPRNSKRGEVRRHRPEVSIRKGYIELGGHLDKASSMIRESRFNSHVNLSDVQSHVRIGKILHERSSCVIGF